ncbi:MAG TPA: hypothetical protein VF642_12485 [Propionibacteriaceae bacterium]|jgi:hypothetical protein
MIFIVALLAYLGFWALVAAYLLWRDRNGHPRDERPIGYGFHLEHDYTRVHSDLAQAQRDRAAQHIAKREASR